MSVNRRNFLRTATAGLGAGVSVLAGRTSEASVNRPGQGPRYAMVIDLRRCFGCHACSVACKAEQNVPLGFWKSWVIVSEKGRYPRVRRNMLPVLCNHCEHPSCVSVCPTNASRQRPDGTVVIAEEDCIGCKYCIQACPYKMRYAHPTKGVAQKCDFCIHRVEQGIQPACVNTCNARARVFGDLNDSNSRVSKLLAGHPVQTLKPDLGNEPRVYYIGLDGSAYPDVLPVQHGT